MKYEIQIGQIFDLDTKTTKPRQTIIITEEQLMVVEQFANVRMDAELRKIYKLNDCEFIIMPHFG